jgi:hypothetical protein
VDTKCTAPSLIPAVNGNTVRSFSAHGQQSAAKGSSTTVSRSDIRLIQHFGLLGSWFGPEVALNWLFPYPLITSSGGAQRRGGERGRVAGALEVAGEGERGEGSKNTTAEPSQSFDDYASIQALSHSTHPTLPYLTNWLKWPHSDRSIARPCMLRRSSATSYCAPCCTTTGATWLRGRRGCGRRCISPPSSATPRCAAPMQFGRAFSGGWRAAERRHPTGREKRGSPAPSDPSR